MTWTVTTYLSYLLVAVPLTIWVAQPDGGAAHSPGAAPGLPPAVPGAGRVRAAPGSGLRRACAPRRP